MRCRKNITLCAGRGQRLPAHTFVSGLDTGWGRTQYRLRFPRPAPLHPAGRTRRPAGRTLGHTHRPPAGAVATLQVLAYDTGVEDAHDGRTAPANLRTPSEPLGPKHRNPWQKRTGPLGVIRHGIDWRRRLLLKGRLWTGVELLPEPCPQSKSDLEITHHAPS